MCIRDSHSAGSVSGQRTLVGQLDADGFVYADTPIHTAVSYTHLKGITGSTIFGYLREYRIKKSLELLDHGQMTIGEVSEAVGFHSVSYFCQCFRKKMRMTPKQYQKRANIAME